MSNDYYTYTATTPEGLTVEVICCGYIEKPEEPRLEDISSINGHDIIDCDDLEILMISDIDELNTEYVELKKILDMILSGDISLTYTGGWCSNGFVWDAEGNDLEELGRIRDAFSLIQSVDPEKLCKALKLPA